MTPKEYLLQLDDFRNRIKRLDTDIEELRQRRISLKSMDYSKDKIMTTPDGQGFTRLSDKYLDMIALREREIQEYKEACHRIESEIWSLDKRIHRDLLVYVYVDGLSLLEASEALHYSYDRVRHVHGAALEDFRHTVMDKW